MDTQLLVRVYRVGFGDCIYVQIPDGEDVFTILVDCGTSSAADKVLKPVVKHLRSQLPKGKDRKPRLDLLVATHPHADHMKGFDPAWFHGITIGRIWMSAFMNRQHPQAQRSQAFEAQAFAAAKSLLERPGLNLDAGVQALLNRSLSLANTGALSALRQDLPSQHPRLYVARDVADHLDEAEQAEHKLRIENSVTSFYDFQEPGTCLRVLAPEWDIDATYLGQFTPGGSDFPDPLMGRTDAYHASQDSEVNLPPASTVEAPIPAEPQPANVSARDFRLLRSRLLYSALAFSQEDDDLKNNVSVVLLLEWRGRRLLFTGDAEWDGDGIQPGRRNSSWDVMLSVAGVRQVLLQPLDIFKVAHHGSHNGTPFDQPAAEEVLRQIVTPDRTQVLISTVEGVHGKQNPVPYAPLMTKLGRLAKNKRVYQQGEPELIGVPQPRRTDRESDSSEPGVDYLEVRLDPLPEQ